MLAQTTSPEPTEPPEETAPVVDTDGDQDGVSDASDNCPTVFNPSQSNLDGDDKGDHCDERFDLPDECGAFDEVIQVAAATVPGTGGGDTETQPLCVSVTSLPIIQEAVPGVPPLIVTETYAVIDVSMEQLIAIEGEGVEIIATDAFAGIDAVELIEARIVSQPAVALETVVVDFLPDVSPEVLELVPDEQVAAQPDETLEAFPQVYWVEVRLSVIDLVGAERIIEFDPALLQLAPGRFEFFELELDPSFEVEGFAPSESTTTTTTEPDG